MAALTDKHVLITGGGSGIGAAIARLLAKEGARITLAGRRLDALQAVAVTLPHAFSCHTDVTREDDCLRLAARAREALGPVDMVIANAGGADSQPFNRVSAASWQAAIDVNLTGTFLTIRACLPDLLRNEADNSGLRRIVCIASTAGVKGYAYVVPYVAAKHGVVGLVRALAAEYARTPLTVNAVCPGYVATPLLEKTIANIIAKTGRTAEQATLELVKNNPQQRLIEPDEIAAAVLWLCSPAARSVTGQAIAVAGGET